MKNFHGTAYLFVGALFLCLVAKDLFSDGMFLDGTTYAAVANNMAKGLGSFWCPHLSNTLYPEFYEHPPLALGLQSLWFRILGDSIYVERSYSLSTYLLTGGLLTLVWRELTGSFRLGWIPLLLWISVSDVIWAVSNNMLENTMTVFTTSAVLFYFIHKRKGKSLWLLWMGLCIFFALFTKGFFCLYLWTVPFFDWLVLRKFAFKKALSQTILLALVTVIPVVLLYFFSEAARSNMEGYWSEQLMDSFKREVTVEDRYSIVINFLERIIPALFIAIIFLGLTRANQSARKRAKEHLPIFWFFLAVSLSGVFPIMISLKQRAYYVLTVYPLFMIGLGYVIAPMFEALVGRIKSRGLQTFQFFSILMAVAGCIIAFLNIGTIGRNYETVHDTKAVIGVIGERQTINVCPHLWEDWGLNSYFARYGRVSLEPKAEIRQEFFLSLDDCIPQVLEQEYERVDVELDKFVLYQLKNRE